MILRVLKLYLELPECDGIRYLSSNTSRKGFSHYNSVVRALSLRDILKRRDSDFDFNVSLGSALTDSAVYVRKTAVCSLLSLLSGETLHDHPHKAIQDSEPTVMASAACALWHSCQSGFVPDHIVLTRLLSVLPQLDHYGQFFAIDVLYRFSLSRFAPHSNHPQLHAFLNCITNDILPYTSSPAVAEICLSVLIDLSGLEPQKIWSFFTHHLYRLQPEFGSRILKLALVSMSDPQVSVACPIDLFFVRFDDTMAVAKLKLKILTKHINNPSVSETHAKIILREFLECISRIDEIGPECVSGIAVIGHRFPGLTDIVLKTLLTLLCDVYVGDDVIAQCVSMLRNMLALGGRGDKAPREALVTTLVQICHKVHVLKNDNAKISALWLLTVYHDSVALVVPNVLRSMGVIITKESCLVKLQLSILAAKSLDYFQNPSEAHKGVQKLVWEHLKEVVEYILDICSKDELVGDAIRAIAKGGLIFDEVGTCAEDEEEAEFGSHPIHSEVFVNNRMQYERPETDQVEIDGMEDENVERKENTNVRNMSSEQSAVNRTSAKVQVPSSVKAITTLEDLDLFFSISDDTGMQCMEHPKDADSTVKATIDLTDLC